MSDEFEISRPEDVFRSSIVSTDIADGKTPDILFILHLDVTNVPLDKVPRLVKNARDGLSINYPRTQTLIIPGRNINTDLKAIPIKAMLDGNAVPNLEPEELKELRDALAMMASNFKKT